MTPKIIKALIPVTLGGLIYITYRSHSLIMFSWFDSLGLSNLIHSFRANEYLQRVIVPGWFKYSLPDALWLYSFVYFTLLIWKFKINARSLFWILLSPVIGIGSEIGQLLKLLPGTFDMVDLLFLLLATILPFVKTPQFRTLKINIQ